MKSQIFTGASVVSQGTNDGGKLMKKIFFIIAFLQTANLCSADGWIQKADYGGGEKEAPVGFSINGKGYIGTGSVSQTFWQYDPTFDTWTQVADLPGAGRFYAVGFSIDSLGYVGTGNINPSNNGFTNDFWSFNPSTNSWTQKTTFAGGKREDAFGFSVNGKGYIGGGDNWPAFKSDLWEYDPVLDTWTQKADYGGGKTLGAATFSLNGKGYVGTGRSNTLAFKNDFWEYDPGLNVWNQKANFPGPERAGAIGFSINGMGYLGLGAHSTPTSEWFNDFWQYDPSSDAWLQKDSFPGLGVVNPAAFVIGNSAYVGTGNAMIGGATKSFYQYNPDTATYSQTTKANRGIFISPNPFSSSTIISFSLEQNSYITMELLDLSGRKMKTLLDENTEAGNNTVQLNREQLSAGIYFLRVKMNGESSVMKIVVQ